MTRSGFYSVVKYVPDVIRREPVNVGVVVADDDAGVHVRFTDAPQIPDPGVALRFESLLNHIAEKERPANAELFLTQLAHRRFSHFEVTVPAQVAIEDDIDRVATLLCARTAGTSHMSRA